DDAHAVGDHVVQLTGDPQPLLGDGPPGQLLPGRLELGRAFLGGHGRLLSAPGPVPQPPGGGQDHPVADCPRVDQPDDQEHGLGGGQAGQRDPAWAAGGGGVDVDEDAERQGDQAEPQGGERRPGEQAPGQRRQGIAAAHGDRQGVGGHQQVGGPGQRRPGVEGEHRGQQGEAEGGHDRRQEAVQDDGPGGPQPLAGGGGGGGGGAHP